MDESIELERLKMAPNTINLLMVAEAAVVVAQEVHRLTALALAGVLPAVAEEEVAAGWPMTMQMFMISREAEVEEANPKAKMEIREQSLEVSQLQDTLGFRNN